jgi:hypothetical protein
MEDDWIFFRRHERWVEEVNVQLQLDKPITARVSGNSSSGRLGSANVVMRGYVVFDDRNIYDPRRLRAEGFEYHGMGRN